MRDLPSRILHAENKSKVSETSVPVKSDGAGMMPTVRWRRRMVLAFLLLSTAPPSAGFCFHLAAAGARQESITNTVLQIQQLRCLSPRGGQGPRMQTEDRSKRENGAAKNYMLTQREMRAAKWHGRPPFPDPVVVPASEEVLCLPACGIIFLGRLPRPRALCEGRAAAPSLLNAGRGLLNGAVALATAALGDCDISARLRRRRSWAWVQAPSRRSGLACQRHRSSA
jgi:hypothetical protein